MPEAIRELLRGVTCVKTGVYATHVRVASLNSQGGEKGWEGKGKAHRDILTHRKAIGDLAIRSPSTSALLDATRLLSPTEYSVARSSGRVSELRDIWLPNALVKLVPRSGNKVSPRK